MIFVPEQVNLAEQVKEKLALEEENRNRKIEALKGLDTKRLIEQMVETEDKLDTALREEHSYKDLNAGFLSSAGTDCAEVKAILAELHNQPRAEKMTANDVAAWLRTQRTENNRLASAISKQQVIAFNLGNMQLTTEALKRRLDGIHKVLHLKTAQIRFLTETDN